jgi:hypothetical protein
MASPIPGQFPPVSAGSESPISPPGPDGFEGLTAAEQAVRAEVVCRAHSIWESKGRPENSQLADWLEAEAEVAHEAESGRATRAAANFRAAN